MEEEITKTLHLVAGLYSRLGLKLADDPELRAMLEPLDPKRIGERPGRADQRVDAAVSAEEEEGRSRPKV